MPLFQLTIDYQDNETFLFKIMDLIQNKKKEFVRKSRKDGSCFYRCFLFRLLEILIQDDSYYSKYKIHEKIKLGREMLLKAGYQDIVFEDFEDIYKKMVTDIQQKKVNI